MAPLDGFRARVPDRQEILICLHEKFDGWISLAQFLDPLSCFLATPEETDQTQDHREIVGVPCVPRLTLAQEFQGFCSPPMHLKCYSGRE